MRRDVRDHALGSALRELEVPEHGAAFGATIRARLDDEATRVDPMLPRSRHPTPRRKSWRWSLAVPALIVAAALVMSSPFLGTTPRQATAAEIRRTVAQAWASTENVRGVLVWNAPGVFGQGERRWSFLVTERGDVRLDDLTRGGTVVYDASTGVERSLNPSESVPGDDTLFANERRSLAPGLPDEGPSTSLLDRSLGSVVRALAAEGGGTVKEITYEGRSAWLLDTAIRPNLLAPELSPNHLAVTVDRETGMPLRTKATHDGEFVWEVRIEDLQVNVPVREEAFSLQFPPGTKVFRMDAGFRRVSLEEARRIVGYRPLEPTWMPDGYVLAESLVSEKRQGTGPEAGNPAVGDIVSQSFRRGLDQFIVTTRPVGLDASLWVDPLASGEGYRDEPERVTLTRGALAGEVGELLIDPLAIPHVWVLTDRLVVTISGDLTREELLHVAESLHASP